MVSKRHYVRNAIGEFAVTPGGGGHKTDSPSVGSAQMNAIIRGSLPGQPGSAVDSHFNADAPSGSTNENIARLERSIVEWEKQAQATTSEANRAKLREYQANARVKIERMRARAPLASVGGTSPMDATEVQEGDIVHVPGLGGKVRRLKIDKAYPPNSDGSRNVDVTNLDTGLTSELTLEPFKKHKVERKK